MTELKLIQLTALENSSLWDEEMIQIKTEKKSKFFTNKKLPSQEK